MASWTWQPANQADNNILILTGDGRGDFTPQAPVSLSGAPYYVACGDANNDGESDLFVLTASGTNSQVLLFTNTGNGSFKLTSSASGSSVANLAVGDFNHDGNLDVAFAPDTNSVDILFGDGAGGFTSTTVATGHPYMVPYLLGPDYISVAIADFNNDGKPDIAVAESGHGYVATYPGQGNWTVNVPVVHPGPFSQYALPFATADFNNDGLPDLVVVDRDSDRIRILLGNGDGSLTSGVNVDLPNSDSVAAGAVIADLNHDGKADLAIAQFDQSLQGSIQGFLTTAFGNGDGTFQKTVSTPPSDIGISYTTSGDFTGKGNLDLATTEVNARGGIGVFLGSANGVFGSPIDSFTVGSPLLLAPGPIAAGDFNRDGKVDLVVGSEGTGNNSSQLYILLSNGDGTFAPTFLHDLAYGFVPDVKVADFNGDGYADLAVTSQRTLLVFLGNGDGTFQPPVSYTALFTDMYGLAVGDFNRDGKADIVVEASGVTLFYAGNGDGKFQNPVSTPTGDFPVALDTGDFNGDGLLDVVSRGQYILLGNGDGTFQAASINQFLAPAQCFAVGDLNGDGIGDLLQCGTTYDAVHSDPVPQLASVLLSSPVLSSTASALQFPAQSIGTPSSPKTVLLSNAGNAPLSVAGISANGDFSQTNTCGTTLGIGKGCSMQVSFTPTANGQRTGTITITDNAKPGVQKLVLTGWAGPPDFIPSVSPSSATVKAGSAATYSLALSSGDGFAGTVQVSCSGAPSGSACTLSQQSVQLAANANAKIQVSVSTTASSSSLFPSHFFGPENPSHNGLVLFSALAIAFIGVCGCCLLKTNRLVPKLVVAAALCFGMAACGGGSGSSGTTGPPPVSGTPPGNYTLMLTMTSGNSTHNVSLSLTVQ